MYPWHSLRIVLSLLCLAAPVIGQAQELTTADRLGIQTVIEQQLKAFRQDDAAAFALLARRSGQIWHPGSVSAHGPDRLPAGLSSAPCHLQGVTAHGRRANPKVFLVGPDGVPVWPSTSCKSSLMGRGRSMAAI